MSLIEQERDAERSTSRASARTSRSCRVSSAGDPSCTSTARTPRSGSRSSTSSGSSTNGTTPTPIGPSTRSGEEATELFEGARSRIAGFLGAATPESIVFNRGTTESINLVAHAWGRRYPRGGRDPPHGDGASFRHRPLALRSRHGALTPSTSRSPTRACWTCRGWTAADGAHEDPRRHRDVELLGRCRRCATPTPRTPSGPWSSWTGRSSFPHRPVDVAELDCDFSRSAGTRCSGRRPPAGCTPSASSSRRWTSFLGGGEMIREVYHDHSTWNAVPYKFEAGTMNVGQVLGAAVDYLEALGMDAVRAHEEEITSYAIDRLRDAGARIFGPTDPGIRGGGVVLVQGCSPPRPRHHRQRGRDRDPRRPSLQPAGDAALRRARHGPRLLLPVQHEGRGRCLIDSLAKAEGVFNSKPMA